jgi:hypothetical protein
MLFIFFIKNRINRVFYKVYVIRIRIMSAGFGRLDVNPYYVTREELSMLDAHLVPVTWTEHICS